MTQRVDATAAYVLHSRPYRETSLLVDLLTLEHGLVSVVARGARKPGSRLRASLQPFQLLQVGWQGRTDLKNLRMAETTEVGAMLQGRALLCGLYLNELVQRLLSPFDPHPRIFVLFRYALNELKLATDIEGALRTFERQLLEQLGFALDCSAVTDDNCYEWHAETGLRPCRSGKGFPGTHLLSIEQDCYDDPAVRRTAKQLMRVRLAPLLGDKPLRSRELFLKRKGAKDD
ncbi:DNA repair protein RecO [Marinobacterium sediminicola]|uniref:DNA repair protein RecO n=1 Tax=Marinobacterium sediminicola TaxID=518898 RepID=A0ABY1S026_9GAMM|nr:DNA repair protein RecO [Marinobacterium sediminicola]ULG69920.1 DNA repair protein RecO [Marinobacterium sediminicola]SMR74369.1 DNA replication and repair protein RecO [Marinobacterium sediminicola]